MTRPNSNTNSLFDAPFSFPLKVLLPSIIAIFGAGFGVGTYVAIQSNKLEILQLKTENYEKVQTEIQKGKDKELEFYSKKVEGLQEVVNSLQKGGKSGK